MPIFDQGYQHWQGSLSGHGWRWLTVARHGIRTGMQNRLLRRVLFLAAMPAVALVAFICLWGMVERKMDWAIGLVGNFFPSKEALSDPVAFRLPVWVLAFRLFLAVQMFFVMLLVLLVGPGLISQDLRFNALPLYFSRPLRRTDYFLGKLGVIAYFLLLVVVAPAVAAWFLGGLFSMDFSVFFATARVLFGVLVYGVVVALSAGLLMLALSSLSRNSRYVGGMWAGFWLLTFIVSTSVEAAHQSSYHRRLYEPSARRSSVAAREAEEQRNREERQRDLRNPNLTPEERQRREWERVRRANERMNVGADDEGRRARLQIKEEMAPAFENDWRPVISYPQNLLRIADALLGAYDARDRFEALLESAPQAGRARPGASSGPRYDTSYEPPPSRWPWYWSAVVLLALAGVSLWALTTQVKTMDRLR